VNALPTTPVDLGLLTNVSVFVRREDLIHPYVSGNKFRKLKYNISELERGGHDTILTFGGAFSNHIAAVAYAGKECGIKTIGVIRGEELGSKIDENHTLSFAQSCGMKLVFVTRAEYKNKNSQRFADELQQRFGPFYKLPEGGTNELAIKGCEEILSPTDTAYDFICASVGTGGTVAGLIRSAQKHQHVIGFSALKGQGLREDISKFARSEDWALNTDYHFGGYAKINDDLIAFINWFSEQNKVLLDPVYTGKMMYGLRDLIRKNYFPAGARVLAVHTGGLQGINGINQQLKRLNKPQINE
jgi:1-aminocyclopropane-1-carboxylate deaminase